MLRLSLNNGVDESSKSEFLAF